MAAIQTLQFQMTAKKLRGHSCMVYKDNKWKLFFVWDSSTANEGYIIGYEYTGELLSDKNITTLSLPLLSGEFYWVNLWENEFQSNILPMLTNPVKHSHGLYFGNHTPSRIQLPFPDSEALLHLKTRCDRPLMIDPITTSLYNEVLDEFGYYDIAMKDLSYNMMLNVNKKGNMVEGKIGFQKFLIQKIISGSHI